jgi:hypothetical protein
MSFWNMIDALPPEERERVLRERAEQFACEVLEPPQPQPILEERKP